MHFFFIFLCEAIGTAATSGLLCQPRVIVKMIVEKQMECSLAGETEVLGENLPQRHFCPSQNPTWPDPCLNPGRHGGKPATNGLSYGAAQKCICSDLVKQSFRPYLLATLLKLVLFIIIYKYWYYYYYYYYYYWSTVFVWAGHFFSFYIL
jgi:hypothetical protein